MELKFYFVRHGKTLFNLKGRMQGWCDSPLLDEGIQQAENVASALRNVPFKLIVLPLKELGIRRKKSVNIMIFP